MSSSVYSVTEIPDWPNYNLYSRCLCRMAGHSPACQVRFTSEIAGDLLFPVTKATYARDAATCCELRISASRSAQLAQFGPEVVVVIRDRTALRFGKQQKNALCPSATLVIEQGECSADTSRDSLR